MTNFFPIAIAESIWKSTYVVSIKINNFFTGIKGHFGNFLFANMNRWHQNPYVHLESMKFEIMSLQ